MGLAPLELVVEVEVWELGEPFLPATGDFGSSTEPLLGVVDIVRKLLDMNFGMLVVLYVALWMSTGSGGLLWCKCFFQTGFHQSRLA